MILRLFFLSALWTWALLPNVDAQFTVPELQEPIQDQVHVVRPEEKEQLEDWIFDFHRKTGIQIQVLIISTLGGEEIESASIRIAEKWKLGDAARDEGLLLLIAVADRKVRIEVGRGLEGSLPDLVSSRLIREVLTPAFKREQYGEGIRSFLLKIQKIVAPDSENIKTKPIVSPPSNPASSLFFLIPLLLPFLIFLDWLLKRRPLLRGSIYASLAAPASFLTFASPAQAFPLWMIILFPFISFFIGYIGLLPLLRIVLLSRGGSTRGGGWRGNDDDWRGGGGTFSGGGASGKW